MDHIRCASGMSLYSVLGVLRRDFEWSSKHLNMPPSETPSSPTLACSTPLIGESVRQFSSRETLLEALPPSHPGWTFWLPNSHRDWTSQFFMRNNSPRAILCQGRQWGSTTSTILASAPIVELVLSVVWQTYMGNWSCIYQCMCMCPMMLYLFLCFILVYNVGLYFMPTLVDGYVTCVNLSLTS